LKKQSGKRNHRSGKPLLLNIHLKLKSMPGKRLRLTLLLGMVGLVFSIHAQPEQVLSGQEDPYEEGLELYHKGQYVHAQKQLDLVAADVYNRNRETRASAEYYAALAAMKLYNGDARDRVEKFADTYELSPLRNQLFLAYANYRFSTKQYREAAAYYEKVDKFRLNEEDLNEYLFKKGYSHLSMEENKQAQKIFFDLKDKNSTYANSAKYYYAHLLYADSNYTEALTNFLPLQEDASFGPLVPYYLAHIYYRLGDYDKLLEVGKDLVNKATPTRAPEIAKLMADAFYNKGQYEDAIEYLELYKEKGGAMRTQDHFQLGYSYYRTGKYRLAIESFNKISRGNEAMQQSAYYHLGDCYLKVGEKQQAITAFKAASEIDASPTVQEDAFFNYGKLVYELSDPYRDAISVLNDFLDYFPESPRVNEVNRYLANLYVTTKDYDKALLAIKRTGLSTPEMKEVYQKVAFYRATEIFNSLKYRAAIDKYEESLQYPINKPVVALSKYWIAEAHYRLEEYDEALEGFEAFRNSPGAFNMTEYNRSLYQTAYTYYKKFDFQNAATHFRNFAREADKKDPRLPDAYLRLADSYLLTGGYLVAADFYGSALKTGTREADYATFQKAECLGLAGKKDQKVAELQSLLKKYPNSIYAEEAQYEIAVTQLQMENYDQAITGFNRFIADHPQSDKVPSSKLQIGLVYSNTDRNAEALAAFQGVVKDYPGTDESIEAVGLARLIYARQNRISDYLDWVDGLNFVNFERSTLDSTAFNAAFDIYSAGDCNESVKALSNYLSRFEKGIFALRANYYLAQCANQLNQVSQAKQAYEAILEFPRNEYTPMALENVAGMAYQAKEYAKARNYYKQLADIAQDKAKRTQAHAGIMRSSFALGDYSEAAVHADLVLGMEVQDATLVLEARQMAAASYFEKGDLDQALTRYEEIGNTAEGEAKAKALYYKADILYQKGDYETSTTVVYKLIEDLPSFKEYKMKALIILAKNFWKLEDIFQANYTLDFVISSDYSPSITEQARNLKEEIKLTEQQAQEQKTELNRSNSEPIILNEGEGLMIIDESEEASEPMDTTLRNE